MLSPERWATVGCFLVIDDAGGGLPVILDTALGSGILDRQRRDSSDQGKATEVGRHNQW